MRLSALGYQALYPADDEPFDATVRGIEFQAHPYDDAQPPAVPTEARLVRLLPGASFPYGPGVRIVYGVVVDGPTRVPVANALVQARGTTSRDGVPWLERTLTDPSGGFRLSLRWEGELTGPAPDQVFHLQAIERPGRTGALDIRLPADGRRRHVIELSNDPVGGGDQRRCQ